MSIPKLVVSLFCLAAAGTAVAERLDRSLWTFNGYGTLGAIHSSEDRADYEPSLITVGGPGNSGSTTLDVDSRIAAQMGFHPTARLSAVVQVVAEDRLVDGYEPKLEWAYLRYDVNPNLSIGAGRTALDTFLVSAHRKVGYALPWVRPPAELYRLMSITSSDGVDLTFRLNRGETSWRTQINYGRNEIDAVGGLMEAEQLWGIYNTLERGPATLHLAYKRAEVRSPVTDPFFALFEPFGPEGAAVKDEYDLDGKWMSFVGVGGSYDPGDWFVMAEWGRGDTNSIAGIAEAWYVSSGYRFGRVMPYVTFAEADRGHSLDFSGLTVSAYPPAVAPVAAGLNALLAEARRGVAVQTTVSLGARWDVVRGIALKAQYDHVDVSEGPGTFQNLEPGFQPAGVDLFSLSVDFLF